MPNQGQNQTPRPAQRRSAASANSTVTVRETYEMIGPILVIVGTLTGNASAADAPLHIGSGKQLFVGPWTADGRDAHLVASMKGIEMTMHEARVTGEKLIVQDRPWEGKGILDMRQFVLKDGDRFRMYYAALPFHFVSADAPKGKQYANLWKRPYQRILCYAESSDGIHWSKPNLGLCEWNGSRQNNILLPNDALEYVFSEVAGASNINDPKAKRPDEKYKMFVKMTPVGKGGTEQKGPIPRMGTKSLPKAQRAFASADAIHWRLLSTKKMNPGSSSDTQYSVFWDDRVGKYVQYTRIKVRNKPQMAYYKKLYDGYEGRTTDLHVGRAVSDDFLKWSKEQTVLKPDAIDQANAPPGLTRMDFYGGNVSRYAEAPAIYIALPNAYYHWKFDMTRKWWTGKHIQLPSTMDVQLVTSRDGIHWHRTLGRRPFIRLGPTGTFWSGTIWPDGNAIRVGDELWFFFAGLSVGHKEQSLVRSVGARGRAVLRLDGFVSARAAYTGGELITKPVVFAGSSLQLNVDTSAGGTVKVEMLDASGKPIDGFTEADSDEINGNHIRVFVTWRGRPDVGALAGKPVRLRFVMRDTDLYAFRFVPAERLQ